MKHLILRGFQRLTSWQAVAPLAHINIQYFPTHDYQSLRRFHASTSTRVVRPFILADIGEGITECQIINWFVQPGDRVEQFDRICEVQSDKASVEITSRFDGTIKALHYGTDDMAVVGQPLLDIDIEDDTLGGDEFVTDTVGEQKTGGALEYAEKVTKSEIQQTATPQEPQSLQEIEEHLMESSSPPHAQQSEKPNPMLTPAIRHMLKKLKLDAAKIQGTGRDGRILKEDIQRHMSASSSLMVSAETSVPKACTEDKLVTLSPTAKQMFKVMTRSLNIPHFLYTHSVDFTPLNKLRKRFNADKLLSSAHSNTNNVISKLTPLPFIIKALSQAFSEFPSLNSHLDPNTDPSKPQLLIKGSHNFGIAIDTPQGLLVPVVRDVQSHSIISLAAEINRLNKLAQEGRLSVGDFKDATFTISNIGSIGGATVSPVIVSPMVGILGIGRVQEVPVFQKDGQGGEKIVKREEVLLSWSADHRILDGATVARCAETVGKILENVDILGVVLK